MRRNRDAPPFPSLLSDEEEYPRDRDEEEYSRDRGRRRYLLYRWRPASAGCGTARKLLLLAVALLVVLRVAAAVLLPGGGGALPRLLGARAGARAGTTAPPAAALGTSLEGEDADGRPRYLLPLLRGSPATQLVQFRAALLRARDQRRTLVLPPFFGAPTAAEAPRPYAFDTTLDAVPLQRLTAVTDVASLRRLSQGRLSLCEVGKGAQRKYASFERFLLACGLSCDDWASSSHDDSASAAVLYLGLHSPAAHRHDLHAYAYLQPAARLEQMADVALQSLGWVAGSYAAAHVAERADDVDDCGLTYLEQRPPKAKEFVACGNHTSRIGPRTHALLLAQQLLHVPAATARRNASGGGGGRGGGVGGGGGDLAPRRRVYVSSSLLGSGANASASSRGRRVIDELRALGVDARSARPAIVAAAGGDEYLAGLVEQLVCAQATLFAGSRYASWADHVNGLRKALWARRVTTARHALAAEAEERHAFAAEAAEAAALATNESFELHSWEGAFAAYQAKSKSVLVARPYKGIYIV